MKTLSPRVRHVILGQWVLLSLLMITTMIMYVQMYRQDECFDRYVKAQNEASNTRYLTADTERQSMKEVFDAIISSDRERMRQEIQEHYELLQRNDRLRNQNPPPELPKAC